MRKVIYICDKCGNETEDSSKIWYLKIADICDTESYIKMLCLECVKDIKRLIDENLMVYSEYDLTLR